MEAKRNSKTGKLSHLHALSMYIYTESEILPPPTHKETHTRVHALETGGCLWESRPISHEHVSVLRDVGLGRVFTNVFSHLHLPTLLRVEQASHSTIVTSILMLPVVGGTKDKIYRRFCFKRMQFFLI